MMCACVKLLVTLHKHTLARFGGPSWMYNLPHKTIFLWWRRESRTDSRHERSRKENQKKKNARWSPTKHRSIAKGTNTNAAPVRAWGHAGASLAMGGMDRGQKGDRPSCHLCYLMLPYYGSNAIRPNLSGSVGVYPRPMGKKMKRGTILNFLLLLLVRTGNFESTYPPHQLQ